MARRAGRGEGTLPRVALAGLGLFGVCACATAPARPPPGDPLDLVTAAQLFELGQQADASGDSIRAEQYYSAALERGYPESAVVPAILAVCIRASRFGDALDHAEPYLARHPEEWALHALVASIYLGLDQPTEALRHLALALEVAPDEPSPHYLMAVLARDGLADLGLAAEHWARYLELAPDGEHAAEARLEVRRAERGTSPPVRLGPASDGAGGEGSHGAVPVRADPASPPGAPAVLPAAPAPPPA